MTINRFDLRLDDGMKGPTSVLVCVSGEISTMGLLNNERRISIGGALYGDRFESFRLSDPARRQYLDAVRTIRWFEEHLRCRMGPEAIGTYNEELNEASR